MKASADFLKQSDIFCHLTPDQFELAAKPCEEVTYQTGNLVFKERSRSQDLYVITPDEVEIAIHAESKSSDLLEDMVSAAAETTFRRGDARLNDPAPPPPPGRCKRIPI